MIEIFLETLIWWKYRQNIQTPPPPPNISILVILEVSSVFWS